MDKEQLQTNRGETSEADVEQHSDLQELLTEYAPKVRALKEVNPAERTKAAAKLLEDVMLSIAVWAMPKTTEAEETPLAEVVYLKFASGQHTFLAKTQQERDLLTIHFEATEVPDPRKQPKISRAERSRLNELLYPGINNKIIYDDIKKK